MEPRLTVTIVPFQVRNGTFCVGTTVSNTHSRTLPSVYPHVREPLDGAAERAMEEANGHPATYLEQLYTLAIEHRDPWRIIVSYIAFVAPDAERPDEQLTWNAPDEIELRRETDRRIFDYALLRLQAKLGYTNIALHLMTSSFTLTELQRLYQQVLGEEVDKRNFRRRMIATGMLTRTGVLRRDGSHRPAALYRFTSEADDASYLTPPWARSVSDQQERRRP